MIAKAREKVRLKKANFSTWRCTRSGQDYKQYTKARNQAKWEYRKEQKEKKLSKESKKNPKAFYEYAQSKLKTRAGIAHLAREDGTPTTTDKQKAGVLNNFFCLLY